MHRHFPQVFGPAVILLQVERPCEECGGWHAVSGATGFYVNARTVVTAFHCVEKRPEYRLMTIAHDGSKQKATVVDKDPDADLAILRVRQKKTRSCLRIARSGLLLPGDPVITMGYPVEQDRMALAFGSPLQEDLVVTTGHAAGFKRGTAWGSSSTGLMVPLPGQGVHPLFGIQGIRRGHSGGPLLDVSGAVVSVLTQADFDKNIIVGAPLLALKTLLERNA